MNQRNASDARDIRAKIDGYHARVRSAATDNEFLDVDEAEGLHGLLAEALDSWIELTADQRGLLRNSVEYFVRTDDEEDDLRSPIGFEDDAAV
jgi:hypothetical protein